MQDQRGNELMKRGQQLLNNTLKTHSVSIRFVAPCLLLIVLSGCGNPVEVPDMAVVTVAVAQPVVAEASQPIPDWTADAVFYQIFPERFANGDPHNDPTRESLENPEGVPESWAVTPWTGDWYARAEWEQELGDDFYENGVFDRRYGGDLQGVLDRLDYLARLGINAIYFNPIFYGRSLHKYDGSSFHHVEPHFGPDPEGDFALMATETSDPATWKWTKADRLFLDLIEQAHSLGIRVIIDGVFNHTGRDFFAFADLRANQEKSPYKDWYIVQKFDDPDTPKNEFQYKGWWGVETLPEFANSQMGNDLGAGPKAYILDITRRWLDPNGDGDPADGIDGWRLDVANEVPVGFWEDWTDLVREINPEAYTVSEVWGDAQRFLRDGGFSATMNYHGFAFPVKGFLIDGRMAATDFAAEVEHRRKGYPPKQQRALQNLIDSHDTDRVASMVVNAHDEPYMQADRFDFDVTERVSPRNWDDYKVRKPTETERRIQRLVALMQMTYVGAPMLYYGTEAGMWGADDPCDRMPMVWPDLEFDPQVASPHEEEREPDVVRFDSNLFNFYQAAISLRRIHSSLRRGSCEFVHTDDEAQVVAFRRTDEAETLLVLLNRGENEYTWQVDAKPNESFQQIFTASGDFAHHGLSQEDDKTTITIPALDGAVFRVESKD